MSLDTALFLVERDRVNHHVSGANAKTVMMHGDRVLVQRGDNIYTTWHSKPLPTEVPYMTRRLTYTREYDVDQGKYVHPSGDGKINLGYDFGTAGDYPAEEWRNVRNQKGRFNDLDGELFVINESTQYEKGDLVRITHEGGDLEVWYSLTDNNWMKFEEHYDDNGRPQANITPVEGTKPSVDDGATLKFEFFKPSTHPFDTIDEDDLLLVWEDNQSKHVTGKTFKTLFIPSLAEWDWKGYSDAGEPTKMCDKPGTAIQAYTTFYTAQTDRNGVYIKDIIKDAFRKNSTLWFKLDNRPAISVSSGIFFDIDSSCHLKYNIVGFNETNPVGILRCYDFNPDTF